MSAWRFGTCADASPTTGQSSRKKFGGRIQDERHSLVIVDPTYKMLGEADENSATAITALLGAIEINWLVSAAELFTNLGTNCSQIKPHHETQLRPMIGLTPKQAQLAWD